MSELARLAADLRRASDDIGDDAEGVVKRGALNVKTEAARIAAQIPHVTRYPRTINFDVHRVGGTTTAEIGPDPEYRGRGLQRGLGNILEFGAPRRNTRPHPHLAPALQAEEPRFVAAMSDIAEKNLDGRV